jgi:hypothetical protein
MVLAVNCSPCFLQLHAATQFCYYFPDSLTLQEAGMRLGLGSSISVVLGALVLTSCGPIYETRYTFSPPRSGEGRNCTYQCEHSKQQCREIEEMRAQRCEEHSRWETERCQRDLERRGKKEHWYSCGGDSCSADYDRCESSYRSCYESCGGRVNSEEVCTMNCEKAPPRKKK